jgi:hypothetical protein
VGDESSGAIVKVVLSNGVSVYQGYVLLRVRSVMIKLIATAPAGLRILPSALADLAKRAFVRANAGLGAA